MAKDKKPNNPFAFPRTDPKYFGDLNSEGMTLRDYFANSAMQVFLANRDLHKTIKDNFDLPVPEVIAEFSYQMSNAMLKHREKDV